MPSYFYHSYHTSHLYLYTNANFAIIEKGCSNTEDLPQKTSVVITHPNTSHSEKSQDREKGVELLRLKMGSRKITHL